MYPNPFIYKKPLDPGRDDLVMIGRTALLEKTLSGLAFGHWYVISGGKKIGKTTFLAMLMEECRIKGLPYHFISIKPEELPGFNQAGLFQALCEGLRELPAIDAEEGFPSPPDLEEVKNILTAAAQQLGTTEKIIVILESFESFPRAFAQEALRGLISLQQAQAMRKLPANFQFIVSGVLNTIDLQIEQGHSFSEYSMRVLLEDFRYEDIEVMLARVSRELGLACEPGFGRLLYDHTSGVGYLVQKICYRTLESAFVRKEPMALTLKRAEAAIASIIKEGETNIEMVITQIEKDPQLIESLMRVLRAGSVSAKKFDPQLKTLLALGALSVQNGFFRPRNRIYEAIFQDYFTTERLADLYFSQQKYQRARELFTVAMHQQSVAQNAMSTVLGNISMIDTKIGHESIVSAVLEAFMNAVDHTKNCSLIMRDPVNGALRIVEAIGLSAEDIKSFELKLGQGVAGWVAQVGRPRFIRDITDEIECPDFAYREMATKYKVGAMASLPLKVSGNVLGVISLCLGKPREFGESETRMLDIMSAYASLALQQVYQKLDFERHAKQVEQVCGLLREAGQHADLPAVFKKILATAAKLCDTDNVYIVHRDQTSSQWHFQFLHEAAGARAEIARGEGIAAVVLHTGETHLIENTRTDDHDFEIWPGMRWELAVPCLNEGEPLGCLVIASDASPLPSPAQRQLLDLLADAIAMALRNKRLYHIAEKKTQQVIAAHGISEALSHENSLQEILNFIARECLNLMGRDNKSAFVWIKENGRRKLILQAADGNVDSREHLGRILNMSDTSLVLWVYKNGQPRLARDVSQDDYYRPTHAGIKSEIAVPLIFRDETIGVLDLQSTELNDFDEQDQEALIAIAQNAAVAMKIGEWHDLRIKEQIGLAKVLEATAIEETIAGLTHDIKNISALIASETQWLEKREREDQLDLFEVKKAIRNINKHMIRIEEYANHLKGRAYKAPPEPQWCSLRNVVGEAVQVVMPKASRQGVEIKRDEIALDLRMYVDPGRLVRAFINIITNALDAMPNGGLLKINAVRSAKEVQINFTDNGSGIPDDMVFKVQSAFVSTKAKGYGLGLTVTKRIVEADHGGKLRLRSKENLGTTVEVVLPIHLGAPPRSDEMPHQQFISKWASTAAQPETEAAARPGNILVVNDDTYMLEKIVHLLSSLGYRVTSTELGGCAVELTQQRRFDAILLDYHLRKDRSPTQTAQDFIPMLKQNAPAAKIIITSASLDQNGLPEVNCEIFLEINHAFWKRVPDVIQRCLVANYNSIKH